MGLFKTDPVVDGDIAAVLLTSAKAPQRAIARWQARFRQLQELGENPLLAAADDMSPSRVLIVAGRRAFIHGPGTNTPERVADLVDIDRATIPEYAAVCLNGLNLGFYLTFRSTDTANTVAARINRAILANRPRSIPRLYPDYFVETLSAAGLPASPHNLLNLANKAAFAIAQQAVIILKQGGHESLFSDFVREFAPKMVRDDQTKVTDDIVDWLWARSPGAHYGLDRQVGKFREFFLKHRGGVAEDRGELEPWRAGDKDEAEQCAEIVALWNLEFETREVGAYEPC
jgi:hypothetical protein